MAERIRVLTVVGARPQFVKAAPVSWALASAGYDETLVHTGQHYDREMSEIFFAELGVPSPDVNLEVGSGRPGWQVATILARLEDVILERRPDVVIVHGDTNSTLGGALAACKQGVTLCHVEAGLRSRNRTMPEEHNRVLTDHCSSLLFCPTRTAVKNLAAEGLRSGVHFVGDTMLDALQHFAEVAKEWSVVVSKLDLEPGKYLLATVHRQYNTDDPEVLERIMDTLSCLGQTVVLPLHPRTRSRLRWGQKRGVEARGTLRLVDPVGYLDMLALEQSARAILTDSGGVQKEAFFLQVPCITLRPETEWTETVESGWNVLAELDSAEVRAKLERELPRGRAPLSLFGDGRAAVRIVEQLGDSVG